MIRLASQRGGSRAWVLLLLLAAAAIGYFVVYPKLTSRGPYAAVKTEAGDLASKCRAHGPADDRISFPRKVLIWDLDAGRESEAQEHLPEPLRAADQNDLGTVVLVLDLKKEETSEYMPLEGTTMGGPPEYRYVYTIGAVAWPEREVAGTFQVIIDPPGMRADPNDYRAGNWFDLGLADWVRARTQSR